MPEARSARATARASALVTGLLVVMVLAGCAGPDAAPRVQGQAATCSYPPGGGPLARPVDPPSTDHVPRSGTVQATLEFTAGPVVLTLDRGHAPCAVHSFESLVQQQFYDGSRCTRLVDTGLFILQCGDPSGRGDGGPGYTFADELTGHETYPKGTVAMANSGRDTNGSQFFICWDDTPLDPHYTVLGRIDPQGLAVVQSIASQGVDGNDGHTPIADATITRVVMG